jgi:hypothetical protein
VLAKQFSLFFLPVTLVHLYIGTHKVSHDDVGSRWGFTRGFNRQYRIHNVLVLSQSPDGLCPSALRLHKRTHTHTHALQLHVRLKFTPHGHVLKHESSRNTTTHSPVQRLYLYDDALNFVGIDAPFVNEFLSVTGLFLCVWRLRALLINRNLDMQCS